MLTDFTEIWWLVCNLRSQCWRRISLKSDVVCQSCCNVYRGAVFSWTRCIYQGCRALSFALARLSCFFFWLSVLSECIVELHFTRGNKLMLYHQKTLFVSIGYLHSCILGHSAHPGDSSTQCLASGRSLGGVWRQCRSLETDQLRYDTILLDIGYWVACLISFQRYLGWIFKLCRTSEFGIISCSSFTKLRLLLSIYVYMYVVVATSQIVWSMRPSSEGGQVRLPQELGHHWLGE